MTREITPTFYGIPLPIAPNPDNWPLPEGQSNEHHSWHPSTDPLLLDAPKDRAPTILELGGAALRASGRYEVDQDAHNMGLATYHRHLLGPPLPRTEDEQFMALALEFAGLIPREGLEMSTGGFRKVALSTAQLDILQTPFGDGLIGYQYIRHSYRLARPFFNAYIANYPIGNYRPYIIEEFLSRRIKPERYRELGHLLIAQKVVAACEETGLQSTYAELAQEDLLDPRLSEHPNIGESAQAFVGHWLLQGRRYQEKTLFPLMAESFKASRRRRSAA